MASKPRALKAFSAMEAMGFGKDKIKPVLIRLLKLFDKNWDAIEAQNYSVLVDAMCEEAEAKVSEQRSSANKKALEEDFSLLDEPERPLKRLRKAIREGHASSSHNGSDSSLGENSPCSTDITPTPEHFSPEKHQTPKGQKSLSPQISPKGKRPVVERSSAGVCFKGPIVDPGNLLLPKQDAADTYGLIKPNDEPFTEDMPLDDIPNYELPIAVIPPGSSNIEDSLNNGFVPGKLDKNDQVPASPGCLRVNYEVSTTPMGSPGILEIASSKMGEVKMSLSYYSMLGRPNFHMPSEDELLKTMQEKCLSSYKNLDPKFSVKQIMKDMCEIFLELATDSSCKSQERVKNGIPSLDGSKKSPACSSMGISSHTPASTSNGSVDTQCFVKLAANGCAGSDGSLVVVPKCQLTNQDLRPVPDCSDITRGGEMVEIPWVNDINNESPTLFYYTSQSLVYQNACVNFTLSQIKAEYCCSNCDGDCLTSPTRCVCFGEAGQGFAYTYEGLVRQDFLEECIAMSRDPLRQHLSYCKACPLERSKNDEILEPCKGHLKRKYIKECWSKCGCRKQCGNRVVQRGIRSKLQVFFTSEGKGWGLRTLEKLPKGAFVCEYAGEILTNRELNERNGQRTGSTPTPVILDAFWFLKHALKDEEALCLDATFHGNIARFINHRCLDANLIEIPVKIESLDHHYYRLAFFTTREVNPLEELTWDYGIDFDDNDHPVKAFHCRCGSKFCRNMKRSNIKCCRCRVWTSINRMKTLGVCRCFFHWMREMGL